MYRLGGLLYNKIVTQFHGYSFCINLYKMKIDMEDPHLWTQIAITTDVKKKIRSVRILPFLRPRAAILD